VQEVAPSLAENLDLVRINREVVSAEIQKECLKPELKTSRTTYEIILDVLCLYECYHQLR